MKHFFDIGANTGQTFDCVPLIGDTFDNGMIWCFEPSPRNLGPLRERCIKESSGPHNFDVRLCPFGLYSCDAYLYLYEDPTDTKCDSLGHHLSELQQPGIYCAVCDIFNFIQTNQSIFSYPVDTITIKIDAEGSEIPILTRIMQCRSLWPLIDCLLVEWHFNRPNFPNSIKAAKLKQRVQNSPIPLHDWIY